MTRWPKALKNLVEMTGLEPVTSCLQILGMGILVSPHITRSRLKSGFCILASPHFFSALLQNCYKIATVDPGVSREEGR